MLRRTHGDEERRVGANLPVVITSITFVGLVLWGLLALSALSFPRSAYGAVALAAGLGLWLVTNWFTRGVRWAVLVIAAVPPVEALLVYYWYSPSYSLDSPIDLAVWAIVATLALADLAFVFGSVHPSWTDGQAESPRVR